MSNFFAQPDALAFGKTEAEVREECIYSIIMCNMPNCVVLPTAHSLMKVYLLV